MCATVAELYAVGVLRHIVGADSVRYETGKSIRKGQFRSGQAIFGKLSEVADDCALHDAAAHSSDVKGLKRGTHASQTRADRQAPG